MACVCCCPTYLVFSRPHILLKRKTLECDQLKVKQHIDYTCDDLGGGAAYPIAGIIDGGLRGRRHVGSGAGLGGRPAGAREGPGVEGGERVEMGSVVRRGAWRGGTAGGRGLRLTLEDWRRVWGWVTGGMDGAVFTGVAPRRDEWVVRGAGGLISGLGCVGAGQFGRGWGLLLGTLGRKR